MTAEQTRIAGLILAAGRGLRMRPITGAIPKALLPVLGRPMIDTVAAKLRRSGAAAVHLNAFHLADALADHLRRAGVEATIHRETSLLGTGGGIGNMAASLRLFDVALLNNCDVIASIDFAAALRRHEASGALATLLCLPPGGAAPPPSVRVDGACRVTAIGGRRGDLGYTGMAVLSPGALARFPADRAGGFVETILALAAERPGAVIALDLSADGPVSWAETGSVGAYLDLHRRILAGGERFDPAIPEASGALHVAADARVGARLRWEGFAEIGPGAVVGDDVRLVESVVFPGAVVPPGSELRRRIVWPGGVVAADGERGGGA
ncbi:MAG: NDP-sugar synthase [Candidatus Krumholzibacteriota bacterium]|nr:NDP-sugar synthase [Candidatus Krumholzibacteriota bacterium]